MQTSDNGRPVRSADPDASDRTGYGNPPKKSRFKPGRSGNPKGRPKGSRGWKKMLDKVANEMRTVTESGKQQHRSTLDLVLLTLRNLAAEGDVAAIRELHRLSTDHGPQEVAADHGYLVVPAPLTQEEWNEKFGPQACDGAPGPEAVKNERST